MGSHKLLLPWNGSTVVECLLTLLLDAGLTSVAILIRGDDLALSHRLREFRRTLSTDQSARLQVLSADVPPAEMRDSVKILLAHLQETESPAATDAWLLIPADSIAIQPETLQRLIAQWRKIPQGVLVPTTAGRRGHPSVFGWALAHEVEQIPTGRGINWLLSRPNITVRELAVDDAAVLSDLDTPEDYDSFRRGR